jgi:hypothetical protein
MREYLLNLSILWCRHLDFDRLIVIQVKANFKKKKIIKIYKQNLELLLPARQKIIYFIVESKTA